MTAFYTKDIDGGMVLLQARRRERELARQRILRSRLYATWLVLTVVGVLALGIVTNFDAARAIAAFALGGPVG